MIICFAMMAGLAACCGQSEAGSTDWPAWRGDGSGVFRGSVSAVSWSDTENVRWKTEIPGFGHSSPVVAGGRVFMTTSREEVPGENNRPYWLAASIATAFVGLAWLTSIILGRSRRTGGGRGPGLKRVAYVGPFLLFCAAVYALLAVMTEHQPVSSRQVICLGREDGLIRWRTQCSVGPLLGLTALTSAASPTPTVDEQGVYAHFGSAGTYRLDFDGNIVWANTDPVPHMHYKAASSPILWADLLIVTHDTDRESYTVALDKKTGKTRWKTVRPDSGTARRNMLDAYATPLIVSVDGSDQLVHYSFRRLAAYDPATGKELWAVKTDAEQIVTSPVASDGLVIVAGECNRPIHIAAVSIGQKAGESSPHTVWEDHRHVPCVSSPVIVRGCLYSVTSNGIASCRSLLTGKILWRERLRGTHYASVSAAGRKLYFTNTDGETTVMEAGLEPHVLSLNRIGEPVFASFAFSQGAIFLRGGRQLYCIAETHQAGGATPVGM